MKKIKRLLLFAILFVGNYHQLSSQVLFYEDFGPAPLGDAPGTWAFPAGFQKMNVDNLNPNSSVSWVNEAWEVREDFGWSVTDAVAFSTSWYNPVAAADDWMWTPVIGPIPANTILSWNARAYDPSYPDGYEVRIMTSAGGPPTGGPANLGNQLTNSTQIFSIPAENSSWTNRTYSLSSYIGQSIYVGYRNTSNDKFLLVIDDIKVEAFPNYDAHLTSVNALTEYTMIPKSQVSPVPLGGSITNEGLLNITNVAMRVDIFDGSMNQIYSDTSAIEPSIANLANANFNAGTWTPPAIADTYTLKFYPMLTDMDEQPANDTITRTIVITDSTYARDDGNVNGQLGIGTGEGGFLGQEFAIHTPARITSVDVYYTQGYTGQPFGAVIWNMSGGFPGGIIAYTDTLFYPHDSASFYTIPIDGGDYLLSPGNYVVTVIEFDSTVHIGLTNNIFTLNRTWVDWPSNTQIPWGNNEDYGSSFQKAYMIRPHLWAACPADIITGSGTTPAGCGLTNGTAHITTTGSGPFSYNWSSGGSAAIDTNLAAGAYDVTVTDINSGCSEWINVTIVNSNPPTANITSSSNESCVGCNDGTATVTAEAGAGGYTYSWSPSGGTAATANGLAPGIYTVTVTDAANCTSTTTVTIATFNSIEDEIGLYHTKIYPNPSTGIFNIKGMVDYTGPIKIEVFNIIGEVIYNKVMDISNELNTIIELYTKPGIYLLRITAGENRATKELIIKE